MRIGIDISSLSIGNSGIQVYIRNILSELQRIDLKNEYYLFEPTPSGYVVNNPKWTLLTSRKKKYPAFGTIWFQWILPWLLAIYKIDCLWAPEYFCPFFVRKKTRVLLSIYDCTSHYFSQTMDRLYYRRFKLFFNGSIRRADSILTISEFIQKEIKSIYLKNADKKVIVGHCGKPNWIIPSGYSAEKRMDFLFFPGNFEPRKNILTLIKALEILYAKGSGVSLHIAGPSGWNNDAIHAYIEKSGIRETITFLGFLEEDVLIEQYCTCKALIFPSLYEGFGMPVLEALCLDCLVLTSKNTVMQEICGNAALYFDPNDPEDMAKEIMKMQKKDFNRDSYLKHKDDIINTYSWGKTAAKILKEIESQELL
jgi:glycosyltransferase involved in cell wall biosynthesis